MLKARISDPSMPVIGCGSPVKSWIEQHYDMVDLEVNQLVRLPIADNGADVIVLIAITQPSTCTSPTDTIRRKPRNSSPRI